MRYRKLDASDDYSFGRGRGDFWIDCPDAVAQAVKTRLRLWQREWFLDLTAGTPYATKVLGRNTSGTRDPAIRARVLTTPGVASITSYSASYSGETRVFSGAITVRTIYSASPVEVPR